MSRVYIYRAYGTPCSLILTGRNTYGTPVRFHVSLGGFKESKTWSGGSSGQGILTLRVHVPNNQVLGTRVIVLIVQALGKYMIMRYLDP